MAADSVIDATAYAAAADALLDADRVTRPELLSAQRKAAEAVADATRARAQRHRRTGRMAAEIRAVDQGDDVLVTTGGLPAAFVISGVVPHTIRAPRGHALTIAPGGRLIGFATAVHHPGTRGDPILADGAQDAAGDIGRILDDTGAAIADALANQIGGR